MLDTAIAEKSAARTYRPHATGRMESLAGLPLATFRARAAAFALDMLLVLITYSASMFVLNRIHLLHWKAGRTIQVDWNFHKPSNIVFGLLYFGLTLYFGNGRTVGKRILGIRVISLVHERVTLWQAMERSLGYGASTLEVGTGFFQFFTNPNRCCVHDRIAETIVVRERSCDEERPMPPAR